MSSPCAFLDKDGTIVDSSMHPPIIPSDKILEDEVIEGLRYLQKEGYKLIIVSNQPWISRGEKSKKEIEGVFRSVVKKLAGFGVKIDDYFYCPHTDEDGCKCRKPKTGMINEAVKKHDINLKKSFMVGDSENDILLGKNAGIKSILVLSGDTRENYERFHADIVVKNINELRTII